MKAPYGAFFLVFFWRIVLAVLFPHQREDHCGGNDEEGQNKPDRQGDIHDGEGFALRNALTVLDARELNMKSVNSE